VKNVVKDKSGIVVPVLN